jgi:hypothetical protein
MSLYALRERNQVGRPWSNLVSSSSFLRYPTSPGVHLSYGEGNLTVQNVADIHAFCGIDQQTSSSDVANLRSLLFVLIV